MKKIIYARCNRDFKENGCINVWSADYPDIKEEVYTFGDINSLTTRIEIYRKAKKIEEEVRKRNGESPFKIYLLEGRTEVNYENLETTK